MPDEKKEDLAQKKENAILSILQHYENDFNLAMNAVISIANAAKRKTSADIIGVQAILKEKEPETEPEPNTKSKGQNNVG